MGSRTLSYVDRDGERLAEGRQVILAAIGPPEAGKTTLLARIHTPDEYLDKRVATVAVDLFTRYVYVQYGVERRIVQLQMKDCGGQERFTHLVPAFCRNVHGAFVVFDSTSERSYEAALVWLATLRRSSAGCLCVLVAAKYDLYEERDASGALVRPQWMAGRSMNQEAVAHDCIGFRTVSSKTQLNVGAVALELTELAYAKAVDDESAAIEADARPLQTPTVDLAHRRPQASKSGCEV